MKSFLAVTAFLAAALWTQVTSEVSMKTGFLYLFWQNVIVFACIWVVLIILGVPFVVVRNIIKALSRTKDKFQ